MGLRILRRAVWVAAALAAAVAALLVLAHTPPARSRVQAWLVRQVGATWTLDLQSASLDYNLFTRRVEFADVRLSAPGHADAPFFAARRVAARLPWAVFRGTVRLTSLEVDDGRVLLVREGGVLVNLPPSSGLPPPDTPRRLDIRGLTLRNLQVDYVDRSGDIEVAVRGLQATLAERDAPGVVGAGGPLSAAAVHVRVEQRQTTSGAVAGEVAFDGSTAVLTRLTAPFPELTVVADGPITRVLDDTAFGLSLTGTLDMARLVEWAPPPSPVAGAATFTGTMQGRMAAYEIRAEATAPALRIGRAAPMPLAATLSLTSARALVERFALTAPGPARAPGRPGTVAGRAVYTYGPTGRVELNATWRDLDMDVALAAYDREPLSIASWQDGEAVLTRAAPDAPLGLRASGRSTALARRDRIAVTGRWNVTLADERWIAGHDHHLLDGVHARGTARWPATDDPARAPLTGPLAVDVEHVGRTIRAARRSGIDVSESLEALAGPVHATLELAGSLDEPLVQGRAESPALVLPTGATGTATADVVVGLVDIDVPHFTVQAQGTTLSGDAHLTGTEGRLAGALAGDVTSLSDFARPWLPAAADAFTGTMRFSATLGGTSEVPDVPWRLTSTPLAHAEQAIGTVAAEGRLLGTVVQLDRVRLDQGEGGADLRGSYDYDSGAYDLTLDGRGLRIGQPFVSTGVESVVADLQFRGAGTIDAPGGAGTLRLVPYGGRVAELGGPANVRFRFADGELQSRVFLPQLRAFATIDVVPKAPYVVRGTAIVSQLDVEPLALAAGAVAGTVSGSVGLSATFSGTLEDPSSLGGFVNLQDVAVTAAGVPVRLDRPARLSVRSDDFTVDDLSLHVGSGLLTVQGRFQDPTGAPLRATFDGPLGDVVTLGRVAGVAADVDATGEISATWESRGSIESATSTVAIRNGRLTYLDLPPIEELHTDATFDGTVVEVRDLRAWWEGGDIEGSARLPLALLVPASPDAPPSPGHVDLKISGLSHEALRPWLPSDLVSGLDAHLSATLALDVASAELSGVTGTLVLDEATVTAAGVPISQVRPARMSIAGGVLHFDDVAFSAGEPVVLGGSVAFGEATTLDVTLTGTPGLRPFSVLSPQLAVDGIATLDLRITGTTEAPRVNGRIELEAGEIVMRDPRVIASDIAGPIRFEGDRLVVSGMTGFLNGGSLEASGTVTFAGVDQLGGELSFQARGVAVEYPRDVDSEIDALLVFVPGPGAPLLRGDVRVLRGAYHATISLPALVALNATAAAPPSTSAYLDALRLDIAVSTEDDLLVDNNYGRFEAGADLRLTGTVGRPGVTGRAELREGGEIFLLGGLYRLNESSISFANPNAIAPEISVSMTTQSNGAEETLTLSGTLDRLETTVTSSDPDLTGQSVLNVLFGGNSLGREDALALLSGELLGVTGRAIGLDSLRLERGFGADTVRQDPSLIVEDFDIDPSTRLTLSKRLRTDVEVILSQDLRQSGGLSGVVSYRPFRGVELRATSRDNSDRAYTLRHEISFGGGRAAAAPRRQLPEVAAVQLDGAGADEAALRERLRLGPGDRFDFVKWRDDIDRLHAWYRERRRLEARVRASRADTADGRTALVYRITPGPETELRVEGTQLSSRLARRLESAWSDSVFDRFLLEELEREVALDVVRRNVIGATVEATVAETSPARKVVTVQVRGGEPVGRREIRIEGAAALAPAALVGVLDAQGLADYVWIDPALAVAPLRSHYAAAGYRTARIAPGPPRVEGDRALLAIAVTEGPVTRLAGVAFDGVGDEMRDAVEDAGRLAVDEPYRPADVEAARRRIEAVYRHRGFNDVAVTPAVAIDDAQATAAVQFAVSPGRQQQLSEVVVSGAARTRPTAVVRALGLDPGTPVDLTQWAQARKRVFDTNVFRQVEVRPEPVADDGQGPQPVRARVTVTEWPAWRLRYGLQLNDRSLSEAGGDPTAGRSRDVGVVADVQNRNVFGRAFTLGLYTRLEQDLRSSSGYLSFPTLFGRAIQTNVFATGSRQDLSFDDTAEPEYFRARELVSVEQRIRRSRGFEATYGYRLTHEVYDAFDPEDPFYQNTLIGRFTSTALVDRRDDPFDAATGWFTSFTAERVSNFESGDDTIKLLAAAYHYRRVLGVTVASAVRLGGSFLDPLGFGERFYVGGADTVRGYAEAAAGPKDIRGRAIGGNAQLILNQELRAPIYRWLKGVAFVDAGNVFTANTDIAFRDLDVGYGVGLRLDTPFSLLRLDLGYPAGGGRRRWYFGIGQVF
ncbi:MAG: translocation/assembly module TamB domain-containing protein [Vicinamibacterales bacterium]